MSTNVDVTTRSHTNLKDTGFEVEVAFSGANFSIIFLLVGGGGHFSSLMSSTEFQVFVYTIRRDL